MRLLASLTLFVSLLTAPALLACGGGGPSGEEIERSRREFQLAAALREEGSIPGAIDRLRAALELDPENAEAHLLMGFIQMEPRHNYALAEEYLAEGIELLIAQERSATTLAEARNVYGLCLLELDRAEEAAVVLRAAAMDELNVAPHLAWGNLGLAYMRQGDDTAALEALVESVRVQPRFCVGYYRMAQIHFEAESYPQAEEMANLAIGADEMCTERYQEAYQLRGEIRARLGHSDEAVEDFERCVEIGANSAAGQACQRLLGGGA